MSNVITSTLLVIVSIVLVPVAFGNYEVQESEYESVLNPKYNLHDTIGVISEPYTAIIKKSVGMVVDKVKLHSNLRSYMQEYHLMVYLHRHKDLYYEAPNPLSGKERPEIIRHLW